MNCTVSISSLWVGGRLAAEESMMPCPWLQVFHLKLWPMHPVWCGERERERAAFLESLLTLVPEVPFPSLLCWISYLLCPMFFSCSFSLAGSQFLENDICHVWSCLYSLLSFGWHSGSVLNSIRKLYSFWVLRKCSLFLTYRVDMLFNTLYMTGFSIWMPWESSLHPVLKFHTDVPYVDPLSFIVWAS